jgi:hypothetical protein
MQLDRWTLDVSLTQSAALLGEVLVDLCEPKPAEIRFPFPQKGEK